MPKLLNLLAFAVGASIAMSGLAIVTPAPAQADEAARQLEMPKRTLHQGWLPWARQPSSFFQVQSSFSPCFGRGFLMQASQAFIALFQELIFRCSEKMQPFSSGGINPLTYLATLAA